MNQSSAVSVFLCSLACIAACQGCQTDAPATSGAAGSSSTAGSAGAIAAAGGSTGGTTTAPSGGASSGAGGADPAASGTTSTGGAGGVAQDGQAGSAIGGTGGSSGASGVGGSGGLPPLEECTDKPSIDRLTNWEASGEGTTVPATGSILVKDGNDYVAKVQFVGAEWHVIPVYIANQFGNTADLSQSSGFTLTYSATAALHVQLRSKSHWDGGDQYATDVPSTNGKVETHFISFAEGGWKSLFGAPVLSYADTLKEGMGLIFVGDTENTIAFSGLRIDGWTPLCQ